ncbi:hypothetical protein [Streptomyces sp. NPDC006739]|uniref:hypothetical protein n=1 Tax=Streptomyces sp. NPDC006739 TaxID=3364763 RepID=UPI0036854939
MTRRTDPRRDPRAALLAIGELLAWWAGLALLWLVFISTVDTLERVVGASAAAVAALLARAGRRAGNRR